MSKTRATFSTYVGRHVTIPFENRNNVLKNNKKTLIRY